MKSLSEKVWEFEYEGRDIEDAMEFKEDIFKLKTIDDVVEYYLEVRGWKGDEDLEALLKYLIIDLKTE